MFPLFRTLSSFGLVCAALWGALPAEAGFLPGPAILREEKKDERPAPVPEVAPFNGEGKEEKSDESVRFVQAQSEAILRSIATHGLMTPLELRKHAFRLRSADGAGDLKAPHLDGIDFMSINLAPEEFGGQPMEEVINEALFSPIGGIFPVAAERSFRIGLPSIESALELMEKRMQANVVIILKTDAKADQIAKLEGPMHWGEMILAGGILAEDIQYILAPAELFTLVSIIFKEQPGITLIPVEHSEISCSKFEIGIALDHVQVPGSSYNRGRQMLSKLRSSPSLSGRMLTLPNYQRHLAALLSGPLKDKLFFEYVVRLPILEDAPFLLEGAR